MFSRTHTLMVLLVCAASLAAQAPFTRTTTPVGGNITDATTVDFDLAFSAPVKNLTASDFVAAGNFTGTLAYSGVESTGLGQSLELTNVLHRAVTSAFTLPNTGDFTVEFWCRPDQAGPMTPFSFASSAGDNELTYLNDGLVWYADVNSATITPLSPGAWHHFAFVRNGVVLSIVVDGVEVATGSASSNAAPSGTLVLGDDQDTLGGSFQASQAFLGRIDEVRVWSVAMTENDLLGAMGTPADPNDADLVHYWSFDDIEDLGVGIAGTNDIRDHVGTAHLDLVNGPGLASGAPSRTWSVSVDTGNLNGSATFNLDVDTAGGVTGLDGTALVGNPNGTIATSVAIRTFASPTLIPQPAAASAGSTTRTLEFDQPVTGVDDSDLTPGGFLPTVNVSIDDEFRQAASFTPSTFDRMSAIVDLDLMASFTFECWFRTTSETAHVLSVSAFGGSNNAFTVAASGTVFLNGQTVLPGIDVGQFDGRWHHLAITRSGGVLKRYFDGVPAGEAANAIYTISSAQHTCMVIGQEQDSFCGMLDQTQGLAGAIDEIRFWSVEKTAAEIEAGRYAPIVGIPSGLDHYYPCNAPSLGADVAGAEDLVAVGASAVDSLIPRSTWNVAVSLLGTTAFLEVDLATANGIESERGDPLDPFTNPVIDLVATEDLVFEFDVAGSGPLHREAPTQANDLILMNLSSPNATHDVVTTPVILAQVIAGGAEPGDVGAFGFPELRLDLASPFGVIVIHDGSQSGPLFPGYLPPGGLNLATYAPLGLAGLSVVLQGVALGSTTTANNIFASSNVFRLDF